jgi:purine-binding chemotaxis protein CheW
MAEVKDIKKHNEVIQIVGFVVDTEEYGLEILKVQEVVRLPHITRLPRSPIFIKGVINLRGNIIPIIDLREKFGLRAKKYIDSTRVIIVEVGEKKIGMIVDIVSQVIRVTKDSIVPPPSMVSGVGKEYLSGVVRLEKRLIMLLKIEDIISSNKIINIEKVKDVA